MKNLISSFIALFLMISAAQAQVSGTGGAAVVGTWTPTLIGSTGGTATLTVAVGSYVNTGTWWQANAIVTASSVTGLTGNIQVGNLPWTQRNTTNDAGQCAITQYSNINGSATTHIQGAQIAPNTTAATVFQTVEALSQPASATASAATNLTSTSSINITCSGHT